MERTVRARGSERRQMAADAVRNAHAYTYGNAYRNCHIHAYTYGDSHVYAYTNAYSFSYGYDYRNAKLHTELHIHIGDRNTRAGSHRHWQPLR